jgi:hypothetical protein
MAELTGNDFTEMGMDEGVATRLLLAARAQAARSSTS